MAFSWSKEQKRAIHESGRDILVSAAAGSGKTAVLSERVVEKLRQGIPVEKLVVLTFTNKAAREMKTRIREKVKEEPDLTHALEGIDQAHIKTFDSFALYLLKTHGHHKNISKRLSVMETTDAKILKSRIMDQLFLERFENGDEAFLAYVRTYGNKSDKNLQDQILYFHDKLALIYEKDTILKNLTTTFFSEETFERLFRQFEKIVLAKVVLFKKNLAKLGEHRFNHDKIVAVTLKTIEDFTPLAEASSYDEVHDFISENVSFPRLPGGKAGEDSLLDEEKEQFARIRETTLKPIVEELKGKSGQSGDVDRPKAAHHEAFIESGRHIGIIVDLIRCFHERHQASQIENECFDYAGVATIALDIINEVPSVGKELRNTIKEILVDEYQDTNQLQESFLKTLTDENLYMVGDVKQSIYRFRHAEPAIFVDKYNAFRHDEKGIPIDLNKNFRSRNEVLDDINRLFEKVMDQTIGGIDYDAAQRLHFANEGFLNHEEKDAPYGLTIHTYSKESFKADYPAQFKDAAFEFFHVARTIKAKMSRGEKIMDKSGLRPVRLGDFTILADRASDFDLARKVFEYEQLPLLVHKEAPFVAFDEIKLTRRLLQLFFCLDDDAAYKEMFAHAFLSVARSFLIQAPDQAVFRQVVAFPKRRPERKRMLEVLEPPFKDLFQTLYAVRDRASAKPLSTLMRDLFESLSLEEALLTIRGTKDAQERIRTILAVAERRSERKDTLKTFIDYFDTIIEEELDIEVGAESDFSKDRVNLMTMHKSKGLQFPVVFITHTGKPFRFSEQKPYAFDKDLGIMVQNENEGLDKNFLYALHKNKERQSTISERLRLLYVALTRAQEQVHVLMPTEEKDVSPPPKKVSFLTRMRYQSFADVFESVLPTFEANMAPINMDAYKDAVDYEIALKRKPLPEEPGFEKTYTTPAITPSRKKAKRFSGDIREFLSKEALAAIDYGNLMHDVLENIDFHRALDPQLSDLPLTENEATVIRDFFDQPFMKERTFIGVYKEHPFAYEAEAEKVSGFIDLLLETEEAFIVVDYKLKDIDKPHYETQIEGYAKTLGTLTDKRIEGYLYSILDRRFKKVC